MGVEKSFAHDNCDIFIPFLRSGQAFWVLANMVSGTFQETEW